MRDQQGPGFGLRTALTETELTLSPRGVLDAPAAELLLATFEGLLKEFRQDGANGAEGSVDPVVVLDLRELTRIEPEGAHGLRDLRRICEANGWVLGTLKAPGQPIGAELDELVNRSDGTVRRPEEDPV
jgi:hypothetical protein